MNRVNQVRAFVGSRKSWLSLKPFNADLEKEFQQHRIAEAIGPIVLLGLVGGAAFLLLLLLQILESKTFQNHNIYTASIRVLAGTCLISASLAVASKAETDPAIEKIMFATFIFLAIVYPFALLFRSTDQNSTSELGLATALYISAFGFRLNKQKFYIYLLTACGLYFFIYFGLRGVLSPKGGFGPPFDFVSRIPETLVPQGQIFVAMVFAFLIFRLMESRSRLLFLREKKLAISNQNRLNLLQAVGHDLRQPMTSILLQQGIAKVAAQANDRSQLFQSLDVIESGLTAMSGELKQLTEIAALQSDEYVPEIKVVEIKNLLRETVSLYHAEAQHRDIALTFHDDPTSADVFVETDAHIFSRVINNLISNAIKYSCARINKQSLIDVRVRIDDNRELIVTVEDNGIGIESEDFERIWQPFFQVANKERNQIKGYGLGLTQVRIAITKLLHHRVACNSIFGVGTEFSVAVPLAIERTVAKPLRDGQPNALQQFERNQKTAIIVEDDTSVRDALITGMEKLGFKTSAFSCIGHLSHYLNNMTAAPDVVLFDYRLPDGSGSEAIRLVIRECRSKGNDIPRLFCVSGEAVKPAALFDEFPQAVFIQKPFSLAQLEHLVFT